MCHRVNASAAGGPHHSHTPRSAAEAVFFTSLGLSINVVVCVIGCVSMFSAMIISNVFGHASLPVIFGGLFVVCLLVLATCLIMLRISQNMDQQLKVSARKAYERIEKKFCNHWKIFLLMTFLRRCGIFNVCTILDETIWTCYAAFIDD
jgi:hypothetical protein